MKTYTYNARFHNNKQATFSGNIQTNESDIDEIVKMLKKDMNKRYGDIFILHQDISYFDAVNENGEIIFKWEKINNKINDKTNHGKNSIRKVTKNVYTN